MKRNYMIDLETMGTGPRAAIVAIGAVEFDPLGEGVEREFYQRVNLASSVNYGMTMEAETVLCWLGKGERAPDDTARAELIADDACSLLGGVLGLRNFMEGPANLLTADDAIVWCCGASFDFPILREAYRLTGFVLPWHYANERDFRTMRQLFANLKLAREGTQHHALDDARHQALHLQKIMKHIAAAEPALA